MSLAAAHRTIGSTKSAAAAARSSISLNGSTVVDSVTFGPQAPDASAMMAAAARRKIPLKVLDIPDADARNLYACDLALVRPDQYVAWRGNKVAADSDRLFARLTGADR